MGSPEAGKPPLRKLLETALTPLHAAISKPAQRAYLGTFLFITASLALLAISTIAYTLFYYNYVPQNAIERTIHLDFSTPYPTGTTIFLSVLTFLQPYDLTLHLHLPHTPANLAAGNFMLSLTLLNTDPSTATNTTLAHSLRPAILPYASPLVNLITTLISLPWYTLGLRTESSTLSIPMFESLSFPRSRSKVPNFALLSIYPSPATPMQFYSVTLSIVARFGGLRWILYNHRIAAYLLFTTTFYMTSLLSTLIAWVVLSTYLSSQQSSISVKPDPDARVSSTENFSDTSRTFPTSSRQQALHYSSNLKSEDIKKEDQEEIESTTHLQPSAGIEADDEDDDDEQLDEDPDLGMGFRDSGIGTSVDDGERRDGVQRRRRSTFGGSGRRV